MKVARVALSFALLACSASGAIRAQAFELNEIGTCAIARGMAATGATCNDPSLIYWSPAATVTLPGWSAYVGVAGIRVTGSFTADTTGREDRADVPIEFPPHVFVNYTSKSGRWAAGLGAYVPYGLTSEWKADFPGRFSARRASLFTIYIQPNFAYRFAKGWSVGGGPVFGYSDVELRQSLDLAPQHINATTTFGQIGVAAGTEFAQAKLEGDATAWGFHVGVHGQLDPNWEIGVRYLSPLKFKYTDADATFRQVPTDLAIPAGNPLIPAGTPVDALLQPQFVAGAPLSNQKVSTRIEHPAQVEVGLGYSGLVNTTLSADFIWANFASFDELPVDFQNPATPDRVLLEEYENSWSVRTGVEHAFAIGIKGRAGFAFVSSPAPDVTVTPLLPDMNRRYYTLGVGVPLSPTYTVDVGYLHIDTSGRRGRIRERTAESAAATAAQLNSGFYTLDANVLSLSLRANF